MLGQLIAEFPDAQGARKDLELPDSAVQKLTKQEAIESIGLTERQTNRLEQLAANPAIVAEAKQKARESGEIVSRTAILQSISARRKPYIINNSHEQEWYTPACYIESARKVMASIDLDPASCEIANETVKALYYCAKETDGLTIPWHGTVWLNSPFNQPGSSSTNLFPKLSLGR